MPEFTSLLYLSIGFLFVSFNLIGLLVAPQNGKLQLSSKL